MTTYEVSQKMKTFFYFPILLYLGVPNPLNTFILKHGGEVLKTYLKREGWGRCSEEKIFGRCKPKEFGFILSVLWIRIRNLVPF